VRISRATRRRRFPGGSGIGWDRGHLGAGFGLSRTTAYRYRDEVLDVLADQAPDLQEALETAKARGCAYLILDGT